MKWIGLVATLCLWSSPAFGETAEEMASACRIVAAAKVVDGQVALPQDFDSGVCWGAFATLEKAVSVIVGSQSNVPTFGACTPETSTRTQLIAIFVEYTRRHPERLHESFFNIAIDSLRTAFPCSPPRRRGR
jgi:hypothetical protein